ncbi:MAG: hypothetical protein VR65_26800 [Desulfobulbaceae bacterium BRH_c16a]|nr:MAG: hypothetical protein VR65_26800 [Desulfobulbaceae bacterium BRH_c16a]
MFCEHERVYEDNLEDILKINKNKAIFYLTELLPFQMVGKYHDENGTSWMLKQEGRRYLVSNKLI